MLGTSNAAVRDNLRAILRSQLYNGVRLSSLVCTSTLACVATFRRQRSEGLMRVRYVLSGSDGKDGCWTASTVDVLEPPPLDPRSPLAVGVPTNRQAWCLSYRTPKPRD